MLSDSVELTGGSRVSILLYLVFSRSCPLVWRIDSRLLSLLLFSRRPLVWWLLLLFSRPLVWCGPFSSFFSSVALSCGGSSVALSCWAVRLDRLTSQPSTSRLARLTSQSPSRVVTPQSPSLSVARRLTFAYSSRPTSDSESRALHSPQSPSSLVARSQTSLGSTFNSESRTMHSPHPTLR